MEVKKVGPRPALGEEEVLHFVEETLDDDLHAKWVLSLAHGTLGALYASSLAIHAARRGLAAARSGLARHAVKHVDRLLSNQGINLEALGKPWVGMLLGDRPRAYVNPDWTEFDDDDHSMLVASVQADHGRSTSLLWRTRNLKGSPFRPQSGRPN